MKTLSINKDQKLYVFNHGKYITCLGFDICENRKTNLAKELNEPIQKHRKGTKAAYKEYERLLSIAQNKYNKTGWKSKSELIPEFIGNEGKRVEVVTKYGDTERYYIGKSTGFIPCHLQISKSNSTGGISVIGYPFKSLKFLS